MSHINETKRREWLRALRQFKRGMKLRAKLGVIGSICKQVAEERRNKEIWVTPLWNRPKQLALLHTCIKENRFSYELLIGFVRTAEITYLSPHTQPTVENVLAAMDDVCKKQSKTLRQMFGLKNYEE